ncbi:hypothetical protein FEM03_20925 [Phragmitibacter flavus]|uniref:Uncharacterized protein n=1 Tax=Phragmitibacter flavus TaxID=2576071 RepID=A0A5R8KB78_9BACT|nr:hypothetical protein [Phragmitibacter flavus]TLD68799.1 hypothetical protein FEM03_20925 [Phragmitibacter flavus]
MSSYYRTKVSDIADPEIKQLCEDLLFAANYRSSECFELAFWKWLGWYFHEIQSKKINMSHFPPQSQATHRIHKLTGTPVYFLCEEIASELHQGSLEFHETTTVLTFLKRMSKKLL